MNKVQLERMKSDPGFIAALDQSGGSTPKALLGYGVAETAYQNDEAMFDLIHQMRTRVITSPAFRREEILGAILFERTMNSQIEDLYTADYLWERKGIVPILKVDKGLGAVDKGVQLMKPMPELDELLATAKERNIFGTKMRSVIKEANADGIAEIVSQQFSVGRRICEAGFVPILEPEVDIYAADKEAIEDILLAEIGEHLAKLDDVQIMFKLSIPTVDGLYSQIMKDPHVLRVVALSGGYSRQEADEKLARNPGLIASFSRALLSDLRADQSQGEFDETLARAIREIYEASIA